VGTPRWGHRPRQAARPRVAHHTELVDEDAHRDAIRRLLHDECLDLRDRVAGCLVLLYAQPISRICMLTAEHLTRHRGHIAIRLGRTPRELPEPLGALTMTLAGQRPTLASIAPGPDDRQWLSPGRRLGTPIDETHLRRGLQDLQIAPLSARTTAQISLAKVLPPRIFADLLGVSISSATSWQQLADGERAHYTASAAKRYDHP
jgi:hypothetical protein